MVIRVEQCAKFEAIPSIIHGTPQFDLFHQFKIGQEWRVERRKIPRLLGSLDHYLAPHYSDVIMSAMDSQITGVLIVYSTVCSGADKKNMKAPRHRSVWGEFAGDRWIPRSHRWIPRTKPVTWNMFPFDDVIMKTGNVDVGDELMSAPPWNVKWVLPRRKVF